MSKPVKISDDLAHKAMQRAKTMHRSMAGQIEYWATIGQVVEENPDLPFGFIHDIFIGLEEINTDQVQPYIFGEGKNRDHRTNKRIRKTKK